MMITIQIESWQQYYSDPDREALWKEHYDVLELAHEGRMEMGPDVESYAALDRAGFLMVLVAREAGKMIGYCLVVLRRHLHYKAFCAFEDSYFVSRKARQGLSRVGYDLIKTTLLACHRRGAVRGYFMTKEFASIARMLEHFGMERSDSVYTIWLGDIKWE